MPLVSDFTLGFFEFSTAVAVVDRSRVGPETNVYLGIARARMCERTTITMIDGRPCVLDSSLDLSFSLAGPPKKQEALSRRGPANCHRRGQLMASHPLDGKSVQSMASHFCYYFVTMLAFNVCIVLRLPDAQISSTGVVEVLDHLMQLQKAAKVVQSVIWLH
ncbi:hypothetical protein WN51_05960 [Melipona quadrifasciata]|uniref:Uncharacterized protein n=1 Tax=Melipona quadrifasciata TaxID=166423 RepID=A0A0N0BIU9_9HYME|nr:hypothetical protein WN51_05960 [Melipona quadrifasciata]